jgi:hypothetical protein
MMVKDLARHLLALIGKHLAAMGTTQHDELSQTIFRLETARRRNEGRCRTWIALSAAQARAVLRHVNTIARLPNGRRRCSIVRLKRADTMQTLSGASTVARIARLGQGAIEVSAVR